MADFVLVHGAWCWARVLPTLWRAGHRAFAISLASVGERAHLLTKNVTPASHIADVVSVVEAEELLDAILVGDSYGGIAITGVADQLHARLLHLVYLDTVVPLPGESWSSTHTTETQAARRKASHETGVLPPATTR